jgi:hypothetical protein
MSKKLDVRGVKQTQFDSGQVLKGSFSEIQSSIRTLNTNTILKDAYTHLIQELDEDERPTKVDYYQAVSPSVHMLTFRADVNGDLAGKYFKMQTYIDKKTHVFYYIVDGEGEEPTEGDFKYPIDIISNDSASLVSYSTRNSIKTISEFTIIGNNLVSSFIDIEYNQFGNTSLIDVRDTGFTSLSKKDGESILVGEISLDYDESGYVVYNGNKLKGLYFNPYTANFETQPLSLGITEGPTLTSTEVGEKQALDVNIVDQAIWNSIEITFPDNVSDLFTYRNQGVVSQTVLVTYVDIAKKVIIAINKTRF